MGQDSNRIRVLIAEDQEFVREAIMFAMSQRSDLELVGEVGTGEAALACVHDLDGAVDVVVMDVAMPGMDGISATREIHRHWPDCAVLLFSSYERFCQAGIRAGARGFLLKRASKAELLEAIQTVHQGRVYVAAPILELIVQTMQQPLDPLSDRELMVLKQAADGGTYAEIGERLGLSESRVKQFLGSILKKLDARDRAHAIAIAFREGLLR